MVAKPKGFLSLRWWRTAGLIFSACCFFGFWATLGLATYSVLAWPNSPIVIAAIIAAGVTLTFLAPAAVALVVGTAIEARMPHEEPLSAGKRMGRLLQVVGSFLLGPLAILAWNAATGLEYRLVEASLEASNNRPIVSGDHVGFCKPPTYLVRDGLPVVELTIRLPRSGFYTIFVNGSDAARHECDAEVDTMLTGGVHQLAITLHCRGANPARGEPIAWPVTVRQLLVRNVANELDPEGDGWYDARSSEGGIATIGPPP